MTSKAVFLDRDGVLNDVIISNGTTYPPADSDSLEILPGVVEAVKRLRAAGYLCIGITNQPDISRGSRSLANVLAMNAKVVAETKLDDLLLCPHDDLDNCNCRKPKPGMLIEAAKKWHVDLSKSWMVGDRLSDVEAGKSAGCKTILIVTGTIATDSRVVPDAVAPSLEDAARIILEG